MSRAKTKIMLGLFCAVACVVGPASSYGEAPVFPKLDPSCPIAFKDPAIERHMERARALIGKDLPQWLIPGLSLAPRLSGRCAPPGIPAFDFDSTPLPSAKAFDQLYFIGSNMVGVWVLKTDAGIIMFDAMNNTDDAQNYIEPELRKLGLDPAEIKYILVTHGHGDHWGGAKYFQDAYGAKVMVGVGDEAGLTPWRGAVPPSSFQTIRDNTVVKLGSTSVHLYIVPGHTPGSIAAIFPVTDHGKRHSVGIFGGFGLPPQLQPDGNQHAGLLQFERSVLRFKELGAKAGVDVAISTHPFFDDTNVKSKQAASGAVSASPWIIGRAGWSRFMDAVLEVARSYEAMLREHPEQVNNSKI